LHGAAPGLAVAVEKGSGAEKGCALKDAPSIVAEPRQAGSSASCQTKSARRQRGTIHHRSLVDPKISRQVTCTVMNPKRVSWVLPLRRP